ncbi:MAG TPA: glycosyltransferase family 2 protein [Paludibacteraceae bacterium]|nr:glycosyltransferase family 2 protein [Paludibacteraceae bacterium]
MSMLSIIVPAYNEASTIFSLFYKISNVHLVDSMTKEIVVVDDYSSDDTKKEIDRFVSIYPDVNVKYYRHSENRGKGAAIRTAISHVSGDVIIIQDADLEYDPEDYNVLLSYRKKNNSKVVYGSRFLNKQNTHSYLSFYLGGRLVSFVTNILYCQNLTDEPTCYKMFSSDLLENIKLECNKFEFCPEVTAKVAKLGYKIPEVPIHYYPRTIKDGKKINWKDGLMAIYTLIKYRFKK